MESIGNKIIDIGEFVGGTAKKGSSGESVQKNLTKLGNWFKDEKVGKGKKVAALFGLTAVSVVALPILLAASLAVVVAVPLATALAPAAAIAQHNGVLRLQPGGVDHHLSHPGTRQGFEVVFDQWLAVHRQQRLGGGIGEGAHALAAASGKDQGAGRLCVSRHATSLGGCRALPQPSPMGAGALLRILRNSGR